MDSFHTPNTLIKTERPSMEDGQKFNIRFFINDEKPEDP